MLFERTTLSRRPAKLVQRELARLRRSDQLSPDLVFRDPYVLDFLGLKDTYAERDLEAARWGTPSRLDRNLESGSTSIGLRLISSSTFHSYD